MLNEAVTQELSIGQIHLLARKRLTDRHNKLMEQLKEENSHKEKYWILGMASCKRKNGKTTIKPFLKAYDVKPDLVKQGYLYEVDNTAATQTLLWVMHPNNKLSIPSIGKSISVAG